MRNVRFISRNVSRYDVWLDGRNCIRRRPHRENDDIQTFWTQHRRNVINGSFELGTEFGFMRAQTIRYKNYFRQSRLLLFRVVLRAVIFLINRRTRPRGERPLIKLLVLNKKNILYACASFLSFGHTTLFYTRYVRGKCKFDELTTFFLSDLRFWNSIAIFCCFFFFFNRSYTRWRYSNFRFLFRRHYPPKSSKPLWCPTAGNNDTNAPHIRIEFSRTLLSSRDRRRLSSSSLFRGHSASTTVT